MEDKCEKIQALLLLGVAPLSLGLEKVMTALIRWIVTISNRPKPSLLTQTTNRGYCIQLNKTAGLANLGRSSLCRGAVFRPYTSRRKRATVAIFCTHYQHPHMNQKSRLHHFPLVLRLGSLTWPCPYQQQHSLRASSTPRRLLRMLGFLDLQNLCSWTWESVAGMGKIESMEWGRQDGGSVGKGA